MTQRSAGLSQFDCLVCVPGVWGFHSVFFLGGGGGGDGGRFGSKNSIQFGGLDFFYCSLNSDIFFSFKI